MYWRDTVRECADRLGGEVRRRPFRRSVLVASTDGFPVEAWYLGFSGDASGNYVRVSPPGWPAATSLSLAYAPERSLRRHMPYRAGLSGQDVRVGDLDWGDVFRVRAKNPETVRVHLTPQRCIAIRQWYQAEPSDWPAIKRGRIQVYAGYRAGAEEIVRHVGRLVDLAKILTL